MNNLTSFLAQHFLKLCAAMIIFICSLYIFSPFLSALIMGALLAMALSSVKKWFEKKGLSHRKSLNLLLISSLVLVIGPTVSFFIRGSKLVSMYFKDEAFLAQMKEAQTKITIFFHDLAPLFGLKTDDLDLYIQTFSDRSTGFLVSKFGNIVSEIPDLALFTLIMWISIYYFLDQESRIRSQLNTHFNMPEEKLNRLVVTLKSISQSVFFSNVLTGVIQAAFVTFGSLIFGIGDWFLVFFITFIASFIPVVGAGPIALVLALYALAIERQTAGVGLCVISFISGTIDNVLRPFLATSREAEVPTLLSLLAVLGGVSVFGLKGLFLGPFVAALAFSVLPQILEDIFSDQSKTSIKSTEEVAVISPVDTIE